MSRTHKDKPNAVQVHQGVWRCPEYYFDVEHLCAEYGNVLELPWRSRILYEETGKMPLDTCDLHQFRYFPKYWRADENNQPTCRVQAWWWYDKPPKAEIRMRKQKPFRRREKKFTHLVAREYNAGFDDAGEDDSILPVTWKGPNTMGGGYWD